MKPPSKPARFTVPSNHEYDYTVCDACDTEVVFTMPTPKPAV